MPIVKIAAKTEYIVRWYKICNIGSDKESSYIRQSMMSWWYMKKFSKPIDHN